ncbi:MAG: hypothetical protein DHS20C15_00110 [Planctomycetota bacterium]|nr:MAG: hypothetical protein DHS20C15_00110 [Planctomycetota bacterium]
MQWGDLSAAEALAAEITEPSLRVRAQWDLLAAGSGRVAALTAARAEASPLAARFLASRRAAGELVAATELRTPALWLEDLRLSGSAARREGVLARLPDAGSAEGLALTIEAWQAVGAWERVEQLLDEAPSSRRLDLARRRQLFSTGRNLQALDDLLADLEAGRAVPASLELLNSLLSSRPDRAREERARAALAELPEVSQRGAPLGNAASRGVRGRLHLAALLAQRAGDLDAERRAREALASVDSSQRVRAERLRARVSGGEARSSSASVEVALDAQVDRPESEALARRRLAHEWSLAARLQYAQLGARASAGDWPGFSAALDAAAAHLPGAPRLAGLAMRDYGWMGEALDVEAATERFPGWLLVGGKGLGLPPMLAVYDLNSAAQRDLPDGGSYLECHVHQLRVPSYLGWRGARFAGAGLERYVFLDHDALRDSLLVSGVAPEGDVPAWPAAGFEQRRALDEPLDVAARVAAAAHADAGDAWFERRLQALAEHERQHIVDTRAFLDRGVLGKLGSLIGAGLLPSSVRAELERRAQLEALRLADDPRIPLAEALAVLPLEGARRASEHARGYAALVAQLVTLIDRGGVLEAHEWAALGLRRDRVLVQQLHLLPPEVVRELAFALE